jgi:phosphoglycolate phosphatase-like HAD superfamily hydrolase
MVAYQGPREGHDAWQGDEYHFHLMRRVARHIGHPEHEAHTLAHMPKEELKSRLEAAGPIPREAIDEARLHQAKVNREHESYERVRKVRERLVKHPKAQEHFQRIHDLLAEHREHGVSTERQLEIHEELRDVQKGLDDLHKEHE